MTNSDDARGLGTGGYALVNGLNMYYEIHGTGQPLVLLHGAFSAIGTSFGELLPALAERRRLIAFELQAHRRTADIDRPLSIEQLADDVAAALRQLGTRRVDEQDAVLWPRLRHHVFYGVLVLGEPLLRKIGFAAP